MATCMEGSQISCQTIILVLPFRSRNQRGPGVNPKVTLAPSAVDSDRYTPPNGCAARSVLPKDLSREVTEGRVPKQQQHHALVTELLRVGTTQRRPLYTASLSSRIPAAPCVPLPGRPSAVRFDIRAQASAGHACRSVLRKWSGVRRRSHCDNWAEAERHFKHLFGRTR